jgi:hypothetical protein
MWVEAGRRKGRYQWVGWLRSPVLMPATIVSTENVERSLLVHEHFSYLGLIFRSDFQNRN